MTNQLIVKIPVDGFYESIHCWNIDNVIEQMVSDNNGLPYPDLMGNINSEFSYTNGLLTAYCKLYVDAVNTTLKKDVFIFESLISPKFYNFETDRLFCIVDSETVLDWYNKTNKRTLQQNINNRFTSRSGFISHYPNNLIEWCLSPLEWDHNQLETLFISYMETVTGDKWRDTYLMDDAYSNGYLYNIVYDNLNGESKQSVDIAYNRREKGVDYVTNK